MAEINRYRKFFEKNVLPILKPGQQKEQAKIAYYLKLYTNLMGAELNLSKRRGFDQLRIVKNMTEEESHHGEMHYINYINLIAKSLLSDQQKIHKILGKDPVADPLYAKTRLLMAQNICVLRILKMSRA
jgi:hypothetical protein